MNSPRMLAGFGLLAGMLTLAWSPILLQASGRSPNSSTPAFQLLTNPGLEAYDAPYAQYQPYPQFGPVDCQVATGWERFWHDGPEPCWADSRVFASSDLGTDWVEFREGQTSQLIVSTEPYTAGLMQQVSGLTPGVGYGFNAALLTIFETSAPPAVNGKMIKQVGMDPTGGTDPQAPTVVWSEADDHDEGPWILKLRTAAWAEVPTMTVFIRVISPFAASPPDRVNLSFLDKTILAQTPVVTATSPAFSMIPTFTVSWDQHQDAPGGEVKKYDVQWLDEAEGVWRDWLTRTDSLQASFVGQRHHAYRFRARALQLYEPDYRLYSPYRPDGDTGTYVKGPKLVGRVLSNEGQPVAGATVAISGTTDATLSGTGGRFELRLSPSPTPQTITVSHPVRLAPAPVYGLTFGPTQTRALTWTLRPPDDGVVNGGFEAGLDGWAPIIDQGVAPGVVNEPVHTGHHALALGGTAPAGLSVGVTQTVHLAGAWEPALSFWYHPGTPDGNDRFNVILTVVTQTLSPTLPATTTLVFTPSLDGDGWRHAWYYPGPPQATQFATVTIRFQVWDGGDGAATTVYLDEVSLGSTPGGPYRIYLPLALKGV